MLITVLKSLETFSENEVDKNPSSLIMTSVNGKRLAAESLPSLKPAVTF